MMLVDLIAASATAAADADEPSKAPYYIAGGIFVAWAVAVSAVGMVKPEWPGSGWVTRMLFAVSAVLAALTMISVLITN